MPNRRLLQYEARHNRLSGLEVLRLGSFFSDKQAIFHNLLVKLVGYFRNTRKEQLKNRMQYGELYHTNYYKEVKEKNRVYYEYYCLDRTEEVPADYKEISFVCLRPDGCLELPTTLGTVCRKVAKTLEGFEGFHFHQLRHTYTSNLLANGAAPKDVQELLGHSDVSTTMNVYAHSTRDAKRKSVRLLDKVVGND